MAIKNLGRVNGLSAYEVWLAAGNTGTAEDYILSLKEYESPNGSKFIIVVADDGALSTQAVE